MILSLCLLETIQVHELCDNFCRRYVECLKGNLVESSTLSPPAAAAVLDDGDDDEFTPGASTTQPPAAVTTPTDTCSCIVPGNSRAPALAAAAVGNGYDVTTVSVHVSKYLHG